MEKEYYNDLSEEKREEEVVEQNREKESTEITFHYLNNWVWQQTNQRKKKNVKSTISKSCLLNIKLLFGILLSLTDLGMKLAGFPILESSVAHLTYYP